VSDACGCCGPASEPAAIFNRAGLQAVSYRSGTWAQFRASMLDALSTAPELAALRTRDDDDFTIALLDAWAVVCDILTFYQERIANEAYLRTATERVSIGELAKLIGYKLRPGLAASVALAFTIDAPLATLPSPNTPPDGLPSSVTLPVGTQGQTVPDPGAQPATFETLGPTAARAQWNAIGLRTVHPVLSSWCNAFTDVLLTGLATGVKVGDRLLVDVPGAGFPGGHFMWLQRVTRVATDTVANTTSVSFFDSPLPPQPAGDPTKSLTPPPGVSLNDDFVWTYIRGNLWADQGDLVAFATGQNWPLDQVERHIDALRTLLPPGTDPGRRVYAMGTRADLFGHNAIDYQTIPSTQTNPYTSSWETATLGSGLTPALPHIDLDAVYPIAVGDHVVLVDSASSVTHYTTVADVTELTRTGFFLSAKVSRLGLTDSPSAPGKFGLRTTQVFIETDELAAADVVDDSEVSGNPLILDGAYLSLSVGQQLAVTGVSADQKARTASEVVKIKGIQLVDGYTVVTTDPALTGTYVRASVTINANVADASHGETTSEILGSGDATTPFQRFALKQPPLTYISAATSSGTVSTLTVRVDGVEWTELEWLADAGPAERVYTVVTAADGKTYVQFGDGVNGVRPGSGTNNIVAEYRHGTGKAGLARAGQISTLLTRPLGLKAVTNPTPATWAVDPESIANARTNAPVTVRTLDRIVSLQDVADFAAASAGIAKASADWVWDGTRDIACVTAAGDDGALVTPGSDQCQNLLSAMADAADGTLAVALCSYVPVTFTVAATITPDPVLVATDVLAAVKAELTSAFSFDARQFGWPVFASEIVAVVQSVPGVVAMTLDGFARTGDVATPPADFVEAAAPTLGSAGLVGAALLTVEPGSLPGVVLA
jgi:hypothetical protein